MNRITIQQAAAATGWSPRMLRYVEQQGLVTPERSATGYRLFGPAQLQRLRTLRELVEAHGVGLSDVGFAARLREDATLRREIDAWLATEPRRPADVHAEDWLRWEQDKLQRLLANPPISAHPTTSPTPHLQESA